MYYSTVALAAIAAIAPAATAHGTGLPKLVGLDTSDLRVRNLLRDLNARLAVSDVHNINARQTGPKECGEGVGSCPAGKCCSEYGYCGSEPSYCYAPGCNYKFGPGCPENNPPSGSNTSSVSRNKVGNIAYGGEGVFRCVTPGTVALTFDDGPQTAFTDRILDLFKSYNAKATFFVTGNNINKGQIDLKHADALKRIDNEGHQVASHTFTHLDLSKISSLDRKNQMWMNEMAIRNVLGKIPVYMRPPYSSCTKDSGCQQDMSDLGYHIINFNVDTDDYNKNKPDQIQLSKDWFKGNITKDGASAQKGDKWLAIGHDILDQTANNLTEFMLSTITQLGYKAVTVGDCLGDSKDNWYRTAGGAGTANLSVSGNDTTPSSPSGTTPRPSNSANAAASGTSGANSPASTGAAGAVYISFTAVLGAVLSAVALS